MKCPICGSEIPANSKFCTVCGTPVTPPAPPAPPAPPVQPVSMPAPPVVPPVAAPETKLLGPWAYFGLQLLFSIPLVGFILLIVFSVDNSNLNRRNFARSYWCSLIVAVVIVLALAVLLIATGAGAALLSELQ